ncbi:MAG: imidazolonepropionase [Synergistaceae bacterium]|jgi:imidazolonepropionase|nr:imidazolonepropionase [Synergistaceae bacterium]
MTIKFFRNARVYTPRTGETPASGTAQAHIDQWPKGCFLVMNGRVTAVGTERDVRESLAAEALRMDREPKEYDLDGAAVIPGFVDPHTHACFAAKREEEFSMRLAGKSYLDILRAGGGILSSVRHVRSASEDELFRFSRRLLETTLHYGTTTIEVKSGYGLNTDTELKMLRVIRRLGLETPQSVVPTFMGAHAVPEEYRSHPDDYTALLLNEMLPAVAWQHIARFCDVFCEEGVFSVEQSRAILHKAREVGLRVKMHADEVHDLGGAALAGEVRAASAEHLLAASDAGIDALARGGVVAVLLPATAYSLKKPFARARTMIEKGAPVALATDLNPGSCFCESMPFVVSLAVMGMDLTPEEALVGATLNAAWAIGMEREVGSLEPGKLADFIVLDGESPAVLAYASGSRPIRSVWKRGEKVA